MSNLSTQISYYLRIAIDINKKIGGTKAYQAELKAKDKFNVLKQQISTKIHFIKHTLQKKPLNKPLSIWDGSDDQQIRQKLRQVNSCLIRIKQSVNNQKSNNTTKQLKKQIIQKLQQQYKNYQKLIYQNNQDNQFSQRGLFNKKNNDQTFTDMRTQLLDQGKNKSIFDTSKRNRNQNSQPQQIQLTQMAKWQKQNEQIDEGIDIIIQKTKTLKSGIDKTGQLLTITDAKIKQLTENVDKVSDQLQKQNKRLKGVVQKFRKPHKFCLDIILTLILIGLLVGIIKVASS